MNVVTFLLAGVAVKALVVGSDFNFYLWYKHGKKYTDWYFNRPFYKDETKK